MFEFLIVCALIWLVIVGLVLANCLFARRGSLETPVGLMVEEVRSNNMADVLTYRVSVGAPESADVVERQLVVAVGDSATVDVFKVFPGDATDLGEVSAPQGASVLLTLVDVDDAGNRSEPAVLEFVAEDTLPPAQPGSFGVTLVRETSEPVDPATDESAG